MTIDWWTLALQTVNFLVLVWILARFFFRPVNAILARRQAETGKRLAEAAAARDAAAEAKAEADKARAGIAAERDRLLAAARADADKEKARLIAEANDAARAVAAGAAASIERERATMEAGLIDRIKGLAIDIARRLLEPLPPAVVLDAFVARLCDELPKLQPETRAALASSAGGNIEVVTAAPLSREDSDRVRGAIETAFGAPLALSFRADPAIIAGIELNSRHAFVRSSWRDDLDRIGKLLSLDQKPAA